MGTALDTTSDKCSVSVLNSCDASYTLSGNLCSKSITCATPGVFNNVTDKCDAGLITACNVPGFVFDVANGVCQKSADCGFATLNTYSNKCIASQLENCSGWSWDGTTNDCHAPPTCETGTYNPATNRCENVASECGTYTWNPVSNQCTLDAVCKQDISFPLNNTIQLNGNLDICISDAVHNCVTGTTYNGLPIIKCEAVPVCNGAVQYDPVSNQCVVSADCPYGSQYACMANPLAGGKMQCSPYACNDIANAINTGARACTGGSCKTMNANMIIDPMLYKKHGITTVPAFVYVKGLQMTNPDMSEGYNANLSNSGESVRIYGDASLKYILGKLAEAAGSNNLDKLARML